MTFDDPKMQKQFDKHLAATEKAQTAAMKAKTRLVTEIATERLNTVVAELQNAGNKDAAKVVKTAVADIKSAIKASV